MFSKALDLTQTIVDGIPDWDGNCGFRMQKVLDYPEGLCVQEIRTPNGIGTHMDAPSHFFQGALDIAQIPLTKLICPAVVINVTAKLAPDYAISEEDIQVFERQYGVVPEGSVVIGYTGWGAYWHVAERYRNADAHNRMHFPKFSLAAVQYLLQRNINGIAIDTLSPDGADMSFPVHHTLLSNGKFIIENIKVTNELPAVGSTLIALPLKIAGATEAPCRVIAMFD